MATAYRILLAKRAAADLQNIFDHIAKDSVRNAAKMVSVIFDAIEGLKIFPHRNVLADQHPKVKNRIHTLPVRPYVVFFSVNDDGRVVRVLRVRHGAMRRLKRYE